MKKNTYIMTLAAIAAAQATLVSAANGLDRPNHAANGTCRVSAPGNANGNNSKPSINDTTHVFDLDEITVTTQAKEVFMMRQQSISSSTLQGSYINNLAANSMHQLTGFVPSLAMPQYGSRLTSSMYIRGIGSRINSPAVGMYIDNMPLMNKGAYNFHIYEPERIDILRGPQGSLYGMNTEGGMIRVLSKNPFMEKGTRIKLGIGSHFQRSAEAAHYATLGRQGAISLAAFYDGGDGFQRNSTTGRMADGYNEAGAKMRLMFKPTQKLTIDYMADYQHVLQKGFAYGLLNPANGHVSDPAANRQARYRRNMLNTALGFTFRQNNFTLSSTTSYQTLNDYMMMDQDYLPADFMHLEQRQRMTALTQEFAAKKKGSVWSRTTGIFGSYQWLKTQAPVYFDDAFTGSMAMGMQTQMTNAIIAQMAAKMIAQGMPEAVAMAAAQAAVEKAGGVSVGVKMSVPGTFRTPQLNLGVYHETNLKLSRKLTATLGLRYDMSRTNIEYDTQATMTMDVSVMGRAVSSTLRSLLNHKEHEVYNQLLPKLGLSYKILDGKSNIYATLSKGYRAGGYNIQMFSDILQTELNANSQMAMKGDYDVPHTDADYERIANTIKYKPEVSWNYEVGGHFNFTRCNMKADISAYYMQIRDMQLSVMAGDYGFGRMMVNAGKSYSCGLEAQLSGYAVDERLEWAINYSLTHAVFSDYKDALSDGTVIDYKDNRVPFIPMHALGARTSYTIPFKGMAMKSLTIGLNATAQGDTYWDEANTYKQKMYALLGSNINAGFGRLSLGLWARNITNTHYNTFAFSSTATGTNQYFAQQGAPLQFGMEVKVKL